MNKDYIEIIKQEAKERQKEEIEDAVNPLRKYSTSQLKAELRRRKEVRNERE